VLVYEEKLYAMYDKGIIMKIYSWDLYVVNAKLLQLSEECETVGGLL
jgi:hypothetical protein